MAAYGPAGPPPYRPAPVPAPVRRGRRFWAGIAAGVALGVFAAAGVIGVAVRFTASPEHRSPGAALAAAPSVRLHVALADAGGGMVDANLTVAESGYATGTLRDYGGGTAELRATAKATALRGDRLWWLNHAPGQVSVLTGRWIRPGQDAGVPVDVVAAFRPTALARLVDSVVAHSTVDPYSDLPRITAAAGGWRVQFDWRTGDVVTLSGPITDRGLRPAAYTGGGRVVTAENVGPGTVTPVDDTGGGSVAAAPEPGDDGDAAKAKKDADSVLPDPGKSGSGSAAAQPPEPPAQESQQPKEAAFETTINAAAVCSTPTCSFTATVHNTGDAPGSAVVVGGVTPVAPALGEQVVGPVSPGGSATTPPFSTANVAPPGGEIQVQYNAATFAVPVASAAGTPGTGSPGKGSPNKGKGSAGRGSSGTPGSGSPGDASGSPGSGSGSSGSGSSGSGSSGSGKADPGSGSGSGAPGSSASGGPAAGSAVPSTPADLKALYTNLVKRGLDLSKEPAFTKVEVPLQPAVASAMKSLLDAKVTPEVAKETLQYAVDKKLLGPLVTFAETGGLQNWDEIPKQYKNAAGEQIDKDWPKRIGITRQLEFAQDILKRDPDAKVIVDGQYKGCMADVFDLTRHEAYQLKSMPGRARNLRETTKESIKQLNGQNGRNSDGTIDCTPPGFSRISVVRIEQTSPLYSVDRDEVLKNLPRMKEYLCDGSTPKLELLRVINQLGTYEWNPGGFGDFGADC
ncbi:hypothetical protein [Actinocatenispora rupis]|uniref:Uncharacterized protein n=1 Tax=Actinocatenispora rupis TaxID=519421 RepID=A0A8J3NE40_9ACTN|nr:hypothetical protein [Actinocatenispora rupis]GID12164.1 hypothetical protein Aru02nite_30530 [Actinocatenispora rupis]